MKTKLILLFTLIIITAVSGQEIEYYSSEIALEPSGLAHQKIETTFSLRENANSFLFSIDQDIENIKVYDNNDIDYLLTDEGILINKDIRANEKNTVFIEFDSKELVRQSGKNFIFSLDFLLPSKPKNAKIKLVLPEGFVLSDLEPSISPKAKEIETDGKKINIIWNVNNSEESFIVVYRRGYFGKTESLWPIYILLILIIILIFIALFIFQRKRTKEFISGTLSEDENKILKIIKENKEITQKKISQLAGFSKSKMSKLAKRLEDKGIIKRKRFFKTNKFELSKKLK
mgnify:CR=1 FL=1